MRIPLNQKQQTMILVVCLAGLFFASKWMFAPLVALWLFVPSIRDRVVDFFAESTEEHKGLLFKLSIFLIPTVFFICARHVPPDDLLREMTANLHHYDYRNLYWGSPRLMAGDTSYWWSRITDWLPSVLPLNLAYLPVQYTLLLGWVIVLPLVVRKALILSGTRLTTVERWALIVTIVSVFCWFQIGFVTRITQARPENLGALIGTAAFLVEGTWSAVIWMMAMLLFLPMYWLSFAYIPAALLARIRFRHRLLLLGILSAAFLAVWVSGVQGNWLSWFIGLHTAINHRVMMVGEDDKMLDYLTIPQAWAAILLTVLLVRKDGKKLHPSFLWVCVLIVWFSFPNMIRYLDDLLPLAAIATALAIRDFKENQLKSFFPLILFGSFFVISQSMHVKHLPNLHIPGAKPGQRVITNYSPAEYFAMYENPELKFTPACEIGYTKRVLQRMSLGLSENQKTSCDQLWKHHIQWVVGANMDWTPNKLGHCLRLVRSTDKGYEIWKVIHHG